LNGITDFTNVLSSKKI